MEDDDAGDLSDGDRVYRPPPERPRPAGKGRRVAAAAVGSQQSAKASRRRGKAPDGPTAQANAAHAASAALPGARRPSWLTEAQLQPAPLDVALDTSPRRRAGGGRQGRGARSGASAPGRQRGAVGGAPPPAHPKKRQRRVRRIDLDAEDSEAMVSDDGSLCAHSQDSDATHSDDEQLALPPKKRRTLGQQAREAPGSGAAPHAEPIAAPAPAQPEHGEEDGGAMDYEPAYSPSKESPPSQAAPQVPRLQPAALPGQFLQNTSRVHPAAEGPAQHNPSSIDAPAVGGLCGRATPASSAEVSAAVLANQGLAPAVTTADEDTCQPSSTPQRADGAPPQQKVVQAVMQDRCESSPQAERAADDEACALLENAGSQPRMSQQAAVQDEPHKLLGDAGQSVAPLQSHGPHSSLSGEVDPQGAQPLSASEPAAVSQSRSCPSATPDAFERVELPGSPASSVDHAGQDSRSQQPVATPPAASERDELPPTPDTCGDERRTNPSSPSQRSRPSPLRQPVFLPQGAAFERAELPPSPSPAPGDDVSVQRGESPSAPTLRQGDAATPAAVFPREELPLSPSPSASAQMLRTEVQSGQERRRASAASIRGPAAHHDDAASQREELPASPSPHAVPRRARAGTSVPRGMGPPAQNSDAAAPASRSFQREELPSSPPPGAHPPVSSGASFQREELPPTPPSNGGAASRAVFQREELPVSPPHAGGAPASGATTLFQREELSPSPQQMQRPDAASPHSAFERAELPPSPMPASGMGMAAADIAAVLQYDELPPAPAASEATHSAPLRQDGAASCGARSLVASAVTSAPPLQTSGTAWASQVQHTEAVAHVQTGQPNGCTSPNGRSAKAMAWLQRRGKLPPMQARKRVSQH